MGDLVPSYPQPYTLFHPWTGRPIYSGPNGEGGYGGPQPGTASWVMPDGRRAWWVPGSPWDEGNRVALGLDRGPVPQDGGIGYDGAFQAAQSVGADNATADLAAAISLAESGAHWSDHNSNRGTGDDSVGVWQINLLAHPDMRNRNLYNIAQNAEAMRQVSAGFLNWTPWTTYRNGAYRQFLRGAGGAGQGPPPPPPPTSNEGPVERLIDGLIGHIPDIPIIGGAIRDGVRFVLHPIAAAIDAGIALVTRGVEDAVSLANTLATEVLHDAEGLYNQAVGVATTIGNEVLHDAEGLFNQAVVVIDAGIHDAEALADAGIRDAETFLEGLVRDAESLAGTIGTEVLHDAEGLFNDAVRLADAGIHKAESIADGALHVAETVIDAELHALDAVERALIGAAEGAVETLARDLVGAVEDAFNGFVRDIYTPTDKLVHHLIDDVLHDVETLWPAIVSLGDWLLEAARVVVIGPIDVYDSVLSIQPGDALAAVRRHYGMAAA